MNPLPEIFKNIEYLLKDYSNKDKTLIEVNTIFKEDILESLSPRQLALYKSEIENLLSQYRTEVNAEAIDHFLVILKHFENTRPKSNDNSENSINSIYDIDGNKIEQLSLAQLKEGMLIAGNYELIENIGTGGMSTVWKVLDRMKKKGVWLPSITMLPLSLSIKTFMKMLSRLSYAKFRELNY